MATEVEPQLLSTNRDIIEHTTKQLGPGAAQRVAGTSHLWRAATHTALSRQGLPLHVTKLVTIPEGNEPMDVCAMPGGDGCLVAGWCGLFCVRASASSVRCAATCRATRPEAMRCRRLIVEFYDFLKKFLDNFKPSLN